MSEDTPTTDDTRNGGRKASRDKATPPPAKNEEEKGQEEQAEEKKDLGARPLTLVNPGNTAVVYDLQSRQLAGGETAQVDLPDRVTRHVVRSGHLLCRDANDEWMTFDDDGEPSPRPLATGTDGEGSPGDPRVTAGAG